MDLVKVRWFKMEALAEIVGKHSECLTLQFIFSGNYKFIDRVKINLDFDRRRRLLLDPLRDLRDIVHTYIYT